MTSIQGCLTFGLVHPFHVNLLYFILSHLVGDDDALWLLLRRIRHHARLILWSRAAELLNQEEDGRDGREREGDAGEGDAPLWEVGTRRAVRAARTVDDEFWS